MLLDHALQGNGNLEPVIDINSRNAFGSTALNEAVNFGASKCVQLLIAAGADVTIPRFPNVKGRGDTPLHVATHLPLATHMHEQSRFGPNVDAIFPMLIAAYMRQNEPGWLNLKNMSGETPLHRHARAGNRAICSKLLELGADVNAVSDTGGSPLLSAIVGHYPMHTVHESSRRYPSRLCPVSSHCDQSGRRKHRPQVASVRR